MAGLTRGPERGTSAFCLKCQSRVPVYQPTVRQTASNRQTIEGACPCCLGKVSQILGRRESRHGG
jgi:hypothetical protein